LNQLGVWDYLVDYHLLGASERASTRHEVYAAHGGPAFLPWHRVHLLIYEHCLRAAGWTGGAPYWDVTIEAASRDPKSSVLFTAAYFGRSGTEDSQDVPDGKFSIKNGFRLRNEGPALQRCLGCSGSSLPRKSDVEKLLAMTNYDTSPFTSSSRNSFRNAVEGWDMTPAHNHVHVFVGGTMLTFSSPNDPVFWLNHLFIDRLWAAWQSNGHNGPSYYAKDVSFKYHKIDDSLFPWKMTSRQVMDTEALGYKYDNLPSPAASSN